MLKDDRHTKEYHKNWIKAVSLFHAHAPKQVLEASKVREMERGQYLDRRTLMRFITYEYSKFTAGTAKLIGPSGNTTVYARIWKSGNDAIRENMDDIGRQLSGNRHRSTLRRSVEFGRFRKPPAVFTFSRDPLDRWLSGYNELETRFDTRKVNIGKVCRRCIFHMFVIGSEERVWAFLHDLLFNYLTGLPERQHMYPQCNVLGIYGRFLSFIGRLENFEADWAHVLHNIIKYPGYTWSSTKGIHKSMDDPLHTHMAAKKLAAKDPWFTKIIQHIMFKDFLCFGYDWHTPMVVEEPSPPKVDSQ